MTYTIIARDESTGQMGVAAQTFNLAVGMWVPWARGGVGVVATQALAERSYGTSGLDLIQSGKSASDALQALLAIDPLADVRQVAMLDSRGDVTVHTGERCFPQAGSHLGDGFCALANMMAKDTVWDAMAEAYQANQGDLADGLLAALFAAQAEGGDMRGQQTCALLVVDGALNPIPLIHLRVDHHPQPLDEMARLLRLHRAYTAEYAVGEWVAAGDVNGARKLLDAILEYAPKENYLLYLRALHLATLPDGMDEAVSALTALFDESPIWRDYLEREATVDNFGQPGLGRRLLEAIGG